jgi:hypothetical protein
MGKTVDRQLKESEGLHPVKLEQMWWRGEEIDRRTTRGRREVGKRVEMENERRSREARRGSVSATT